MPKSNIRSPVLDPTVPPVILVTGPSGVGKSTISQWVAADLQFIHYEMDLWHVNGIDVHGFRQDWNVFFHQLDPAPLSKVIRMRVAEASCSGAVLSFPSNVIFTRKRINAAMSVGIRTVVLYGSARQCIDAFLDRERTNGRGLSIERWHRFNARVHARYGRSEYDDVRVEAFRPDGSRWPREDIVAFFRRK